MDIRIARLRWLALVSLLALAIPLLITGLGYRMNYVVLSESMVPVLHPGDLVITNPMVNDVEIGDIVAFQSPLGGFLIHRIMDVVEHDGEVFFVTKGDANAHTDSFLIPGHCLIGKLFIVLPRVGSLFLAPRVILLVCNLGLVITYVALTFYLPSNDEAPVKKSQRRGTPKPIQVALILIILSITFVAQSSIVLVYPSDTKNITTTSPLIVLQEGTQGTSTITDNINANISVAISETYIEDFVDNNTSDVDSSLDKGTHSNFTAQQFGPDSIYDTLAESTSGDGTLWLWQEDTSGYISTASYETYEFWSSWTTNSTTSGTITKIGIYIFADPGNSPQVKLGIYDDSGGSPNNLLGETNPVTITGAGWLDLDIVGTGVNISSSTTYHLAHITDVVPSTQWRYRKTATPVSDYKNGRVWDNLFDPAGTTSKSGSYRYGAYRVGYEIINYELDLEVQFIDVVDFHPTEKLCINAGTLGSEDLRVDYWNGTGWENLSTDLTANSWNNYTVSLTSTTFTVRFKGGSESGDTTKDQWQIDAVLLRVEGAASKEDAVDQQSDVDEVADVGTHSNFSAQQSGPDSIYDTLIEENTSGASNTTLIDAESFEGSWPPTGWTETSYWNREFSYVYDGSYSADFDGDFSYPSGYLTSPSMNCSDASAIYVDFWWYDYGLDFDDFELEYYDGSTWDNYQDLDQLESGTYWHHYTEKITDNQYFVSNFRIRWWAKSVYSGETGCVDLVTVKKEVQNPDNYQLDLEVQWTGADFYETNEELCVYLESAYAYTHSLNATGGYMLVGDGTPNWGSTTGTISFWVKFDTVANRPWGQHDNMESRFSGTNLWLDWGASDSLTSTTSFTADTWYFIAITWDEFTNDLILYVGDEDNAPTQDAANTAWFSAVSTVGVTQNNFLASKGGVSPIDGQGDDLRYWNTDRSLAEIQSDYNVELTGSETNLRSYFKLNNNFDDAGPDNNNGSGSGSHSFSTDTPFTTSATESLQVDVWDGASWQNVFTDLTTGWNNGTVASYLTSTTFTIRFRGATETDDTTQESWNIDVALLHVWSEDSGSGDFNYVLTATENSDSNWTIRFDAYDQSNIGRLTNCSIYLYDGANSTQIVILNGGYDQQTGPWHDLSALDTNYIWMHVDSSSTGTSYIYTHLEILALDSGIHLFYKLTFEIT